MSIGHNPKVVTDGLVFSYDMGNNKKSWKGAPATNLYPNPVVENGVSNFSLVSSSEIAPDNTFTARSWTCPNTASQSQFWWPYIASTATFTYSVWLKASSTVTVALYPQGSDETERLLFTVTTSWQRFSVPRTMSTSKTVGGLVRIFSGFAGTLYIWGHQFEQNAFATPFVVGTRSNTQAIVDLTNNNTITANSLTYNTDGTFSFNGSNTYASFNNPMSNTGPYTVIQWLKPSSALIPGGSGTNKPNGANRRTSLVGPGPVWSPGIWMTSDYIRCHAKTQHVDAAINWTTTTWNMIGMTYDGTNCQIIFNGGFLPIAYTTSAAFANASTIYLGAETSTGSGVNWLGNIGITQIYNRVLTTIEVAQNYNTLKERFIS